MRFDIPLVVLGVVIVGTVLGTVWENRTGGSRLDRAQARFEHRDKWPTPADFAGWRSSGALKCRDFPSLRICEAIFPLFDDGKPIGKDRVTFACSPDDCQWVDP